ncbi:cold shock domain-containing protein [Alteromonas sp. a30]|uniref:cold shock domain-containing protein n=1 Tax=Alteromonas sp. a30 TaxID=2730917 RepID=UPI00227E0C0F|nr:cold shock domain-containing protein [Alteromonas sp. a30]MCY7295592.1 cold shock domain-containing protein [Alteromonas sp. a30]
MKGKIVRWEDNRGFGFIKSAEHEKEVFIHISKFKRGDRRPKVGDVVEFDLDISTPKPTAVRAALIGVHSKTSGFGPSPLITFGTVLLPLLIWVYMELISPIIQPTQAPQESEDYLSVNSGVNNQPRPSLAPQFSNQDASSYRAQQNSQFRCEGKQYCSDMNSCEEALFYLNHCPNVKIDGDNDGKPCERRLCN